MQWSRCQMNKKLPITEELDFHYLLNLMPLLHNEPEYAWLPELFSTIDYENLIKLCNYAGGEVIKIPTLNQLSTSIDSLQWFYDTEISHKKDADEIPLQYKDLVLKIKEIYNARNC